MLTIGLTGSIGAGKSTVLAASARAGVAAASADAFVHALYRAEGVAPVRAAFPEAVVDDVVDRSRLAALVAGDPERLALLESIVHPLVRDRETAFRTAAAAAGRRIVVVEVPLLVETAAESRFDVVVTVEADEAVRRARVMQRPGMTAEKLTALTRRQATAAQRRRSAHVVIDNGGAFKAMEAQVAGFVRAFAPVAAIR